MSKKIFTSRDDILAFIAEAQSQLESLETSLAARKFQGDGDREITIKFKMNDVKDDRKAFLAFSPKAWIKMYALVDEFKGEVQWHGVVERKTDHLFLVKDILIFPHEATGATVVSNQEAYEAWLNDLDDDTFNACRLHGHSHVYMGVTPSGVDMTYRHNVLDNFGTPNENTDLFYIFIITNKRREMTAEIYDLQNNALYSTEEISIKVITGSEGYLDTFVAQAKACVKDSAYSYTATPAYQPPPAAAKNSGVAVQKPIQKESAKAPANHVASPLLDDDDPYDNEYDDWHRRIYGGH